MEDFEKWFNEQKNSVAWSLLGEESRLYQAWVCGAMNQARLRPLSEVQLSALDEVIEMYIGEFKNDGRSIDAKIELAELRGSKSYPGALTRMQEMRVFAALRLWQRKNADRYSTGILWDTLNEMYDASAKNQPAKRQLAKPCPGCGSELDDELYCTTCRTGWK